MDYFKKIERSVTISADKRSTVDLQVDVWSQDLNVTKFILKLDTTDSATIDLTNATVRVAMVYNQDGQDVKIEAAGIVEDVATQKIAYVMDDKLAGFEGLVIAGFYVTLNTGQRIDIQNVTFNMRKSLLDKDLEAATDNYYQTFDDIVADVQSEGEKAKTEINAVPPTVTEYATTQKQAIDNIVSDVQSTGDAAKGEIKATLPTLQNQVSELKSDLRTLLLTDINIIQDRYVDIRSGIAYNNGNLGLNATDYIEISEFDASIFFYGLYYNEDNYAGLAFYDHSKTFIPNSGVKLYQLPNNIAIPSFARFIRVTVPQTNTTFALSFASDNAKVNAFIDETRNKVVTDDECTFIEKSKNLFDKNTVTLGYYVDPGTGNLLENANFWVSDFIKVEPNQSYTIRYKNQGAQYNERKQGIGEFTLGYSDNTSALPETGTTKPNAKYVRFCGSLAQLGSDQLEKGDVFTSYEEFSKKIDSSLIPETHKTKTLEDIIYKIFSGTNTKIKLVGDSITHGVGGTGFNQNGEYIGSFFGNKYYRNPNGYCWAKLFKDYLESKFSCSVTNNAVSGTSFNELNNAFTTLVSDSDDIVICMYGTNNRDSLSSMPAWIQSFINKCNDLGVDLIIMTPIPASITDETKHTNHIEDVCNTIKKLCIKNNVVCIDTNQIMLDYCEYRNISINTLLTDGLHPNDNGYLVMFNAICKSLGITRKVTDATW